MPTDKFGLPFLYPTKKTGGLGTGAPFFYQQSNDIRNDSAVKGMTERTGGGGISDVNTSTGEFTCNYESSDSFTINKDPSFSSSIGGNDMNFAQTEARGYGYKADQPRDVELKMLAKFIDSLADTGLSLSGPTGRHQTPEPGCQGFAYMFSIERPNTSPQQFRFRKEMWHVNYDTDPKTGTFTHPSINFAFTDVDRYVGICYVRYNKQNGRGTGKDSVVVEGWVNPDPASNPNNWIMVKRTEDTGGWGDGGTDCDGEESQVGTWSNAVFRIKASDMTVRYKNVSLREIDPSLSFDDNPDTPPTTEEPGGTSTISTSFKFQQDINTYRTSACAGVGVGGGAGTGNTIFWTTSANADTELSNSATFENRTRVVEIVKSSSSPWAGKTIEQLDVPLKKIGTPTTPNISAKIWSASGTVRYTSPTTIDPATLTTSFVKRTFDFGSNTHVLVVGDRVGVEWTGTSSTNYVLAGWQGGSVGTSSIYANYENGVWDEKNTRDWAVDAWE